MTFFLGPQAPTSTQDGTATEGEQKYSFSLDYGKDLLADINQAIHRGGTNALVQDCLKRCYREITKLRAAAGLHRDASEADRKCPSCGFWGKTPLFAEISHEHIHDGAEK